MPQDEPVLEFTADDRAEPDEVNAVISEGFAPNAATLPQLFAVAVGEGSIEKTLLKIGSWPETKTESKRYCKDAGIFGKHCVRIPQFYRRTSVLRIVARVTFPKDAEATVKECFDIALTGAVLQAVVTGNIGGAEAVFKTALVGCLTAKSEELARQVRVKLGQEKTEGQWHKI
jgi:hypothetical protein